MDEMRSRVEELEHEKRQLVELQRTQSQSLVEEDVEAEASSLDPLASTGGSSSLQRLRRDYIGVMRETELLRRENRELADRLRERDMFSGRMQHMLTEVAKEYEATDDSFVVIGERRRRERDAAIEQLRRQFSFSVDSVDSEQEDVEDTEDAAAAMAASPLQSSVCELLDQIDRTCDAWRAVFCADVLAPVERRLFSSAACLRTTFVVPS
ncbi:hypothetical protein PINS_up005978 [Pythium insidiosum]|nr:hypothetical protein PINS_up005978 [Pythium insidiosum]